MDLYEEIVELLGLESRPELEGNDADEIESKLLRRLEELNKRIRSLNREIDKVQNEIEDLRDDVSNHNQIAVESMREGDEGLARHHLRKKKDKIDKVESRESQLSDLRKNKTRINDKREEIEDKLIEIRKIKG